MIENFKKYVQEQGLIKTGEQTLLAVSGGLDSVVMADLFSKSGYPFAIAHCNFQLRGQESEDDALFVQHLAAGFQVDFFIKRFDTNIFAKEHQLSIQVAARELRYTWFETFYPEYHHIAVAHHQNDALETMIYNIAKGTGLAGVRGIKAQHGHIIRPLLFSSRDELESYAKESNIEWREDSSNASDKYARNRIRHEVIPVLKSINPSIEKTSSVTFERLSAIERLVESVIKEKEGSLYYFENGGVKISIDELNKLKEPMVYLTELVKPFGFSYVDCKQIILAIGQSESKWFLSKNYELFKDRGFLLVSEFGKSETSN